MELETKLRILADGAKYDASCASSGVVRSGGKDVLGSSNGCGICHSYTPDGRCVSLLKILLTNYCTYDCLFCVNRISSDIERARFTPQEVISLTMDFYRRNFIEGLFLSSGILRSADYTMEQLVAVARGLREEHHFNGYIHLKAIPGASPELLQEAGRLADRLSANIELPKASDLAALAPEKKLVTIESTMQQIREKVDEAEQERAKTRLAPSFARAGQSTQLVVGATESTDRDILTTASHLYSAYQLKRIYYSGFSPFPKADTRLPLQAAPLVREHRLYQADWLVRYYGFEAAELTTAEQPNFDAAEDPKLSWALRHREFFPVDVNLAPREHLLRIPGLGYRNVQRLLSVRRYHRLALADLAKLRVSLNRAKPFIVAADYDSSALRIDSPALSHSIVAPPQQLALFASAATAVSGEI